MRAYLEWPGLYEGRVEINPPQNEEYINLKVDTTGFEEDLEKQLKNTKRRNRWWNRG